MNKNLIYRRLTIFDVDLVMEMDINFRKNFVCEENVKKFFLKKENIMYVALDKNKIVGFVYGYILDRLNDIGSMLYIHEVGVLEDYQRSGVATNILKEIEKFCIDNDLCRYFLITQKSNKPACLLYESVGMHFCHNDDIVYYFNINK